MAKMEYGDVDGVGKPISRIVQGTTMVAGMGLEQSFELLDAIFEQGCNAFDTAHVYGFENENTVGQWINQRGIREQVVAIAKGAHHSRERRRVTPWDITAEIYDSLARFETDYLDLYILHRDDPTFPVGPIIECLNEHVEAGRIRAFGGSNWSHIRVQEANTYAKLYDLIPFALSNPNFSLAEQYEEPWSECVTISGEGGKEARDWYEKEQLPLFTWSSMAGGFWSGRYTRENYETIDIHAADLVRRCYCREDNFKRLDRATELGAEKGLSVPQIATAYILSMPLNIFALIASMTGDEFKANLEAMSTKLTPEECAWLDLQSDSR